jgi:hypothetical protein
MMAQLSKIFLSQPEESGTIKFRVSSDAIVCVWMERSSGFVLPDLLCLIFTFDIDGAGRPVGFFARHVVASFEKQYSLARRRQRISERPAACTGADDDDVVLIFGSQNSLLKTRNGPGCLLLSGHVWYSCFIAGLQIRPLLM